MDMFVVTVLQWHAPTQVLSREMRRLGESHQSLVRLHPRTSELIILSQVVHWRP